MVHKYSISKRQQKFLSERLRSIARDQPRFPELRERLLTMGGCDIVPRSEADLEKILARAVLMNGEVWVESGMPIECHSNSAYLWDRDRKNLSIITGWALSGDDDGLWRQHTWLIKKDGNIIETTIPRAKYYGFVLTTREALKFLEENK